MQDVTHSNRCQGKGFCTGSCLLIVRDYVNKKGNTVRVPVHLIEDLVDSIPENGDA